MAEPKETMDELINRLALAMAQANPDAAEALAMHLGPAARSAKVGGQMFGISLRVNQLTERPELRGGDLLRGYVRPEEGAAYNEVIGWEEDGENAPK